MGEQLLIRISKKFLLTTSCVIKGEKALREKTLHNSRFSASEHKDKNFKDSSNVWLAQQPKQKQKKSPAQADRGGGK